MSKETGGPAFPCDRIPMPNGKVLTSDGMTMRDYFAAKAMQGFLGDQNMPLDNDKLAEWAYKMADAMIQAREQ